MAWYEKIPESGRYRGRYRDRRGNKRTLPHTYSQPSEAERDAALREDEIRKRPAAKKRAGRIPWGQWCDEWVPERKVEPGTAEWDRSRIERHVRPYWADVPLEDIDRDAVVEWAETLRTTPKHGTSGEPLSAATVLKIVRVFSASMRAAVRAGKIDVNPCADLELDRPEAREEYFLAHDEYERLLTHADELTRMIVEFGVGTGLRWGELAGLHRRRVDTEHQRITVQEVFDKGKNEIKPYPKGKLRRGVPITRELAERLDEWMRDHPAVSCRTRHRGDKPCRDALLFPSQAGTVIGYGNFRRRHWDGAVTAAGLTGLTPHDLRHTYASWLIQSKRVTLDELGTLLGHADRATTQRYAHFGEDHWSDVRSVLGDDDTATDSEPDEETLRAALAKLAAEKPEWAAAARALDGTAENADRGNAAPDLPQEGAEEEGGKIVHLERFRRSAM